MIIFTLLATSIFPLPPAIETAGAPVPSKNEFGEHCQIALPLSMTKLGESTVQNNFQPMAYLIERLETQHWQQGDI